MDLFAPEVAAFVAQQPIAEPPPVRAIPSLAEQWRADIARRQAIIAGAADWQECGRRLHAAGEMSDFTARALDLIP
jgi:hypothetical protein